MHSRSVRRLALQVAQKHGVVKASQILSIHRSTIWRWKKHGIDPAARQRYSKLFYQCESPLRAFFAASPFSSLRDAKIHLQTQHQITASTKSIGRMVHRIGLSRKRAKVRGAPKGDLDAARRRFRMEYMARSAHGVGRIVSIDECAFSERLKPVYGYAASVTEAGLVCKSPL
jgi:transposase